MYQLRTNLAKKLTSEQEHIPWSSLPNVLLFALQGNPGEEGADGLHGDQVHKVFYSVSPAPSAPTSVALIVFTVVTIGLEMGERRMLNNVES